MVVIEVVDGIILLNWWMWWLMVVVILYWATLAIVYAVLIGYFKVLVI